MNALVPVVCACIGALTYSLAPPKLAELGRVTFMSAMIGLMIAFAGHSVHLF
jgi:hypothetical protein